MPSLIEAWSAECAAARASRRDGDSAGEWNHLERAHILSQPMAVCHVRTHGSMFVVACRHRQAREIVGQLFRVLVAAPGSWTGRYPAGNTGGADVSAFTVMAVPADLQAILDLTPS